MINNVILKRNRYICGKGLSMRRTIIVIMTFYAMLNCIANVSVTQSMYLPPQNVVAEFMEIEDLSEGSRGEGWFWNFSTATKTDNNARFLDILTGGFISRDALAGSYPHLSPYSNCANNPLIYIDPTGNDVWQIDNHGYIVEVEKTTEYDKLEMVGEEDKSITFKYGTIISQKTYEYEKDKTYDVWKVRGDENATKIFKFMSDNITGSRTKVEIGLAQTGIAGDKGLNFITTGHARGSEPGLTYLFKDQLQNGYTIRTITHSHPESNYASKGDKKFVEWIKSIYNRPLLFNIYYVPSGEYINIPQL